MRFLVHEHRALIRAITEAGCPVAAFSFVKKRGKVHIVHAASGSTFTYFRKKETRLNSSGNWEDSHHYIRYQPLPKQTVNHWDDLLELFRSWVQEFVLDAQ